MEEGKGRVKISLTPQQKPEITQVYWSLLDKIPDKKCHMLTEEKLYKTEARDC